MKYVIDKTKVKALMKEKHIHTQKELANMMDITPNQLSLILSHNFNPLKSNVCKLADVLGGSDVLDSIVTKKKSEQLSLLPKADPSNEYIDVSNIKPKKDFNVVELFAGAGGLALGLEEAGFKDKALVEIEKDAVATLKTNRPKWNVIHEDITKITADPKGIYKYISPDTEIDLLSGGYPCQSFSYAGKRRGLEDTRGTLFHDYASILEQLKPKMFLVENVRGLTTMDHGRTLTTMINVFEDIGYHTKYKVLNAWNYGVAEKRQRMILIGIRDDLNIQYKFPKAHEYKPVLRDVLKNVPDSPGAKYSKRKYDVLKLVPAGGYWRDLPDDIAKEYMGASYYSGGGRTGMARRLSWDEPSLTLTTSPSQKQTERCHPEETRPFTTREYARIQSFPDSWKFEGGVGSIYKQIGNAVAVNFAKDIGLSIIAALNQL
ncbi:DNA (cytosine-5-)-methyltransferase [Lactobacillus helveticus]|uniref:DNA (cytosine-5-)-methyltransferase n=1 Tax=Lactobacillus helveticus TaxID=1587 RepID=UPI0015626AC1|nr:DNA (cytosine-5-)-methyltransferase [Lactobacillus helveticus]NRO87644.1 Modification methylase HaeIII [Lactobacillus helveticus]